MGAVRSKAQARGSDKTPLPPQAKVRQRTRKAGTPKKAPAAKAPKAPNARDFMPLWAPTRSDVAGAFGWAGANMMLTLFCAAAGEGIFHIAGLIFMLGALAMGFLGVVRAIRHFAGVTVGAARLTAIQTGQKAPDLKMLFMKTRPAED